MAGGVHGGTSRNGKIVRQEPSEWPLEPRPFPAALYFLLCPVEAYLNRTEQGNGGKGGKSPPHPLTPVRAKRHGGFALKQEMSIYHTSWTFLEHSLIPSSEPTDSVTLRLTTKDKAT